VCVFVTFKLFARPIPSLGIFGKRIEKQSWPRYMASWQPRDVDRVKNGDGDGQLDWPIPDCK